MDTRTIPDDVARFVLLAIASVPHLEAILLLRGDAGTSWTVGQVAQRLYLNEKAVAVLLDELAGAGVIEPSADAAAYRYRPAGAALAQIIDRLADSYARNLVGVSQLIHSRTNKKAQRFAAAFQWRKDD